MISRQNSAYLCESQKVLFLRAAVFSFLSLFLPFILSSSDNSIQFKNELDKLAKYGLPDISGAKYTSIITDNLQIKKILQSNKILEWNTPLDGNSWLIKEELDEFGNPLKGTFIIGASTKIECLYADPLDENFDLDQKTENALPRAKWLSADIEHDSKIIKRFLDLAPHRSSYKFDLNNEERAKIFIFAMRLYQLGRNNEGNQILCQLATFPFEKENESERFNNSFALARNYLAKSQYLALYDDFKKSHNWREFRNSIEELLQKYGTTNWNMKDALQKLNSKISCRISTSQGLNKNLSFKNEHLKTLAAKFADISKVHISPTYSSSKILWLIPNSWHYALKIQKNDIDLDVRRLGVEAIPFLLELANDDETLTFIDYETTRNYFTIRNAEDEKPQNVFSNMSRPATVSEVAVAVLRQIIPQKEDPYFASKDTASLLAVAKNFYSKNRELSPAGLAIAYIRTGNFQAANTALSFISDLAVHSRVPEFEHFILNEPNFGLENFDGIWTEYIISSVIDTIENYIALHVSETPDLVKKITAKIEKYAKNYQPPSNLYFRTPEDKKEARKKMKDYLEKRMKNLINISYSKEPKALLNDCLQENASSLYEETLMAKLKKIPVKDAFSIILEAATNASTTKDKEKCFEILKTFIDKNSDRIAENPLPPSSCEKLWRKLVYDNEILDDVYTIKTSDKFLVLYDTLFGSEISAKNNLTTFGDSDVSYDKKHYTRAQDLIETYGERGRNLLKERFEARLIGTPIDKLPPYPDDKKISNEESDIIAMRLDKAKNHTEIRTVIEGLSIYELSNIEKVLRRHHELAHKILSCANEIVSVKTEIQSPELNERFNAMQGKIFNANFAKEMCDFVKNFSEQGYLVKCRLKRRDMLGGCELLVKYFENSKTKSQNKITGFTGIVFTDNIYANIKLRFTSLYVTNPDNSYLYTYDDEDIAEFWEAVDKFCGPEGYPTALGCVIFATETEENKK